MSTGNARAALTAYFRKRTPIEASDAGRCLEMLAQNVDPQRQEFARCVSSAAGRWTAVLNHIYMADDLPTQEFRLDMFSHYVFKCLPRKYDESIFYAAHPANVFSSEAERTRTPEWHFLSLPRALPGPTFERKITLGFSNGGDADQYGAGGPYAGLDRRVRLFSRHVAAEKVWRASFKFEIDSSRAGDRTLGNIRILTVRMATHHTTGQLRDSVQIWVGCDESDSVASFHYTFVEKRPLKQTYGHHILSVDDVVHLGDAEYERLIESRYTIKLRTHLAPTGTTKTVYPLPELVLTCPEGSEPDEGNAAPVQETIPVKEVNVPQVNPLAEDDIDPDTSRRHLESATSLWYDYPMMGDQSHFEEACAAITLSNVPYEDPEVFPTPYS